MKWALLVTIHQGVSLMALPSNRSMMHLSGSHFKRACDFHDGTPLASRRCLIFIAGNCSITSPPPPQPPMQLASEGDDAWQYCVRKSRTSEGMRSTFRLGEEYILQSTTRATHEWTRTHPTNCVVLTIQRPTHCHPALTQTVEHILRDSRGGIKR